MIRALRRRIMWHLRPSTGGPILLRSKTEQGGQVLERLVSEGLYTPEGWSNPLDHIGHALRLAKQHGIELAPGITNGSVRAYLPENRWKGGPTVNWIPNGSWVDRQEPCEAICCCLLSCRQVGIL